MLTRQAKTTGLRRICVAVLSLALLAICGSGHAQPISTVASQQFIKALIKPNPALWTDAAVTGFRASSALGALNPGVAIAATIAGIYLMQCSAQNFSGCIPAIQLAPLNKHPDLMDADSDIPKSMQVVAPTNGICRDYRNGSFFVTTADAAACITYADWWMQANWGCSGHLGITIVQGETQIAYCNNQVARFGPNCPANSSLNQTTGNCESLACPSGSTDNGNGTCHLAGTPLADAIPTLQVDASGNWTFPSLQYADPDTGTKTLPSPVTAPFTWSGLDENGNPVTITVVPQIGGGLQLEVRTQGTFSGGNPVTDRRVVTFDSSGTKTSDTDEQYGGTTSSTPPATSNTGVTVTPVSIDLPTDYNREATQQAVRANTETLVSNSNEEKADREAAKALGDTWSNPSHTDGGRNTVEGLSLPQQWTPPDTSGVIQALPQGDGSCTTLAVSLWHMPTMTLDPCPIVTVARPIINWFALALSTLAAGFAVLRGSHAEA